MVSDEGRGRRAEGGGCEPEDSGLEHVLSTLRADVPVRGAWREAVLGEVGAMPKPGQRAASNARRWTISPPTAIAAALAFTALGAMAGVGVVSFRDGGVTPPPSALTHPPSVGTRPPSHVRFALVAPGASRVSLVGDFNRWDASATPMRALGDGRLWVVEVPLPAGRHVYAFVVDGDVTPDPSAPRAGEEDFGVPSSVVLVGNRGS